MSLLMAQRVLAGILWLVQVVALARRHIGLERQVTHADDGINGCADFVAHIGQKGGLGEQVHIGRHRVVAGLGAEERLASSRPLSDLTCMQEVWPGCSTTIGRAGV